MRHMVRAAVLFGAMVAVAAPGWWSRTAAEEGEAAPAAAPAPEPSAASGPAARPQGMVGVMLHLGAFTGMGAGVQIGTPAVGLRLSGGWEPTLLALTQPDGTSKLKFYSSFLASPDLYVRLASPRSTLQLGAEVGYRYSTLLGSGVAVGGYAQVSLGKLELLVNGGLLVFPSGETRLKQKHDLSGYEFSFPGPNVNLGISVGLLFFP